MNFLNALEQLLGGAAHNAVNGVQAAGDAVNQGVPAVSHAIFGQGGPIKGQMLVDPKYLGHPADNSISPQFQQAHPMLKYLQQQSPLMQLSPAQSQAIKQGFVSNDPQDQNGPNYATGIPMWNGRSGAPIQNNSYMTSPNHAPIPSFMGNQYAQSNAGPAFTGQNAVDPMIFGYPPDNSAR